MFFVLSWVWEKEKNLSTHEELNLRPSDSVLHFSTTEPQRLYAERGLLQSSYDMFQHTARISNVNSVKFVNRIKEMISFEFGKEMEKDVFLSCHKCGSMKKMWVPIRNQTSDLRNPHSVALSLSHRDSMVSKVYYEVLWMNITLFDLGWLERVK